jgi:tetratricopeptide (TPR) repeat protein
MKPTYLRILVVSSILLGAGLSLLLHADGEKDIDKVTQQATQLESQLSKMRNTSAEAAEVMLKLIDLYHDSGRVFGLIRVSQSFVALHTTHAKHKEVMLKLIDGLQATARNKELIATSRQFLVRHPKDPACVPVERLLARLLIKAGDTVGAAAVNESRWRRLGATEEGREAGVTAASQYFSLNNADGFTKAATLGDEMLDKLPASGPATTVGWQTVDCWERVSNWAKANLSAAKLLQKSPPTGSYLVELHRRMGENYARIGQRANAIDSFRKVLAMTPRADVHLRLVQEIYASNPKPPAIEPVVAEYYQKYPEREDRFALRTLVGLTYQAAGDKGKAQEIFAEVMPFDARSHNIVGSFVGLIGPEPVRLDQAEQVMRDAIAKSKNPSNAVPIRYHLALDVYRDRRKDLVKARAAVREFLFQFPVNEAYSSTLIGWLLDATVSEAEFQQDFTKLLEVRQKYPYWEAFRGYLPAWIQANAAKKELAKRIEWSKGQLAAADKSPVFKEWIALENALRQNNVGQFLALRGALLAPARVKELPDGLAGDLFYQQQYYLRHQAGAPQNAQSVAVAKQWSQRFPKAEQPAYAYLSWATDFVNVKEYRDAILAVLAVEPTQTSGEINRRLMQSAVALKDVELGKQCYAWIRKAEQKFGPEGYNNSSVGDALETLGMKTEALECWRRGMTINLDTTDSRNCVDRVLARVPEADRPKIIDDMMKPDSYWHFSYAMLKADALLKAGDHAGFEKVLRTAAARQRERAIGGWNAENEWQLGTGWVNTLRNDMKADVAAKRRVFTVLRDVKINRPSAIAAVALLELPDEGKMPVLQRLLALNEATLLTHGDQTDWDMMLSYAQAAMTRKDYVSTAGLMGSLLSNYGIDDGRRKTGRDMLTQAYSRLGAAGAAIDDNSPIAPLLQAALHLRLGDEKLALEVYVANRKLFDEHRGEVPVDLLLFVCETHSTAGGDEQINRAEDILRSWLIKNGETKEIDDNEKARVQLLLARNYFRAKRFDLARAEYLTVLNRYAKTPQAVEAEFGIGETYMEQKVYDLAEQAFERLASRRDRDVVIRAEFLRGVLASRRGERDEARAIFRSVLERVPTVDLANQVLYNLSEVYGAEQRYMDQLELLRTVGRLGRNNKRWHTPGEPLSIVVQDSDLGVSRGHARIPVRVTTEPGGDEEIIYLTSGGAGKGLFRADLETRLGSAVKGDKILQLTGRDVIKCDYPESFKKEFRDVPLPDAEIRIASDAKFQISSSKIVDESEENFSQKLNREANPDEKEDKRKSIDRPKDQIKPGNLLYLRVVDADRDLTNEPDVIQVKLTAASGDQVSVTLKETGPHTGIFEGTAKTGELPAGALATNTAIDHSPLMAIDKDKKTYWLSEPDGVTPKVLTIDMKDLKRVDHVTISTPDAKQHSPVRGLLEGSNDGRLWFRLASNPIEAVTPPVVGEFGRMSLRTYDNYNATGFGNWAQVVELSKSGKPTKQAEVDQLSWTRTPENKTPTALLWQGKVVQQRAGAARFTVPGDVTALMVDGYLALPVGPGNRTTDVWLDAGLHDLTIFAAAGPATPTVEVGWFRADNNSTEIVFSPFKERDFDLKQAMAKPAKARKASQVTVKDTDWEFQFEPAEVRYVRLVVQEYRGEAVAINHVEIADSVKGKIHIPTETDLLSLANNDILEIAGGDVVTASYVDEFNTTGSSRLLTAQLKATYHNAVITPIAYDFVKSASGQVFEQRKTVLRVDPGDRFIVEVVDFDMDRTDKPDTIKIQVQVNDGEPVELTATETGDNTGTFTKEVDTSAKPEKDKLTVKPGDRILCRYLDEQNTLPGHAVYRETVVLVNEPTEARIRVIETRVIHSKDDRGVEGPAQVIYLPLDKEKLGKIGAIAFETPLTIEVIDPDAAKDSHSTVTVVLTTTDGAKIEVECVISDAAFGTGLTRPGMALEEGRFIGQVILQLGGKDSPSVVPLTANMPRNLIGGPKIPKDDKTPIGDANLITRVLSITGKDIIDVAYIDAQRPKGEAQTLTAQARMVTDGKLTCTDGDYQKEITAVHVGERLYLKVVDADLDRTNERDKAKVTITTKRGEKEVVELIETSTHSGVFTGSLILKPEEKPTPGNLKADNPTIECWFGDTLEIVYVDESASTPAGTLESKALVQVVVGTDGKLAAFSKTFSDEALAVETQFHIAESHFELFKSHKALSRDDEAKGDLEAGRRVLREVMEDFPNPKYVPRIAYLLGQFSQELKQWGEAIESYQLIVKQYPDDQLAAEAQFKLAQCYEEAGEFNQALEAYVTLAATYPKNPLIANVMLRISEHFYKAKNFKVAAQVGEKFLERFDGHNWTVAHLHEQAITHEIAWQG